jgi:hypothetical protein
MFTEDFQSLEWIIEPLVLGSSSHLGQYGVVICRTLPLPEQGKISSQTGWLTITAMIFSPQKWVNSTPSSPMLSVMTNQTPSLLWPPRLFSTTTDVDIVLSPE